jgi:hypothetical protein
MIFIEKSRRCGGDSVAPVFVFTGLKTEIGLINDPYLWITGHNLGCRCG